MFSTHSQITDSSSRFSLSVCFHFSLTNAVSSLPSLAAPLPPSLCLSLSLSLSILLSAIQRSVLWKFSGTQEWLSVGHQKHLGCLPGSRRSQKESVPVLSSPFLSSQQGGWPSSPLSCSASSPLILRSLLTQFFVLAITT